MTNLPELVASLRRWNTEATPGPWLTNAHFKCVQNHSKELHAMCYQGNAPEAMANLELIATMRNALPTLLEAASLSETYRVQLDEAKESQRLTQKARVDDRECLQQKCSDWGTYWRAPDAHGVKLSIEQAVELLQDALNVEVEIKLAARPAVGVRMPQSHSRMNLMGHADTMKSMRYVSVPEMLAALQQAGVKYE